MFYENIFKCFMIFKTSLGVIHQTYLNEQENDIITQVQGLRG